MSKRSAAKFNLYTQDLADSIELMFVAAIRKGLEEGFEKTLQETTKDSGNATVHWVIGVEGKSNPANRARGKLNDLRETDAGVKHPWVGKRRAQISSNDALAKVLIHNVLDEELKKVINKHIVGQKPSLKYSFYNPTGRAKSEGYDKNANIERAGNVGLETAIAYFNAEIARGNIRRHRRT